MRDSAEDFHFVRFQFSSFALSCLDVLPIRTLEKMSASEGFYYESAATGRFRRCYGASTEGNTATSSDESNRLRLQILPNQNLSTNRNRTEKELDLESMIRLASVGKPQSIRLAQ